MELGKREIMAKRAAEELHHGDIVNLGIGIPTLVANFIPDNIRIVIHSENGFLGIGSSPILGEEDPDLVNAGGFPVTLIPGGSYFDSLLSFSIVRGGHLDITILGALEVSEEGDLANWIVPGKLVPGMGGGMDLAEKAKRTIVLTTHTDKKGKPKIVKKCSLPLTAQRCVDLIITDMAVLKVEKEGLILKEIAESSTVEEVIQATDARIIVSSDLKVIKGL